MECHRRYFAGVLILFFLLITISVVLRTDGRELRPSDHGLTFQNESTASPQESPDMLSFFGGKEESKVPLPEARNFSDPAWWSGGGGRRGNGGGDHVRKVWLVASLVCGVTGVALMAIAAFIFIFRVQMHSTTPSDPVRLVNK